MFHFTVGDAHYEVLVSIASVDETADRRVSTVVGLSLSALQRLLGRAEEART